MNKIYMQSIDLDFIKNYLRIEQEFKDDDLEIEIFMQVAKDYLIKRNINEEIQKQLDQLVNL